MNRDQSDRFFFGGVGQGRGLFVLLSAVGFSGFCVMTIFYFTIDNNLPDEGSMVR